MVRLLGFGVCSLEIGVCAVLFVCGEVSVCVRLVGLFGDCLMVTCCFV